MFQEQVKKWREDHDLAPETHLEDRKIETAEKVVGKAGSDSKNSSRITRANR